MKDVYQRLAEFLDTLPQRYPLNSESGIELKILKHIFTPEDAEWFMRLKPLPESAAEVAERIGRDPEETEKTLYDMSKNGLIFRMGKLGEYKYMVTPFLVGIIEFQMNRMTPALVKDMEEFAPVLYEATWMKGQTRDLRTIPVGESVSADSEIMPYESAEEVIKSARHISISDCMCRRMTALLGKPCDRPMEVCFHFGSGTHYFVENGLGRYISQEEALAILKKGVEAGLVCQLGSSQNPAAMCMCCNCCCEVLVELKNHHAKPSDLVNSNFFARVDEDGCTGCEICIDRCQMEAITVDDVALVDLDRCIGCGLCAVTCPTEAIKVYRKDAEREFIPERTLTEATMAIYRQRRES
ncbi:MAG: 4Fe-4S binding protein [Deltaproteobacteria bacterium]|nr:4Fe-4S binding protein [Deltaproteobacteria bacterium]